MQLSTRLGVSRSCLDCLPSLFFCKNTKIKCFAFQADISDEGQIYLSPSSTNETKIVLRTGKRSILMWHNLMKKYGTVNSLGLVKQHGFLYTLQKLQTIWFDHNRSQTRPSSADPGKICDHFPIKRWQLRPQTTCKTPGIVIYLYKSATFNLHNTIGCYTNCQNTHDCVALKVENWSGSASTQLVRETSRVLKGCLLRKNFKRAW